MEDGSEKVMVCGVGARTAAWIVVLAWTSGAAAYSSSPACDAPTVQMPGASGNEDPVRHGARLRRRRLDRDREPGIGDRLEGHGRPGLDGLRQRDRDLLLERIGCERGRGRPQRGHHDEHGDGCGRQTSPGH